MVEIDGIKAEIIKTKGKVKKVKLFGTNEIAYIVTDNNGHFAHGKTIKEAKQSLLYKISQRDTSAYKNLTLSSKLTFDEAIKMYRTITGACEFGTFLFIKNKQFTKSNTYTVKEIIELTSGQYGNQTLKEFFKCKKK